MNCEKGGLCDCRITMTMAICKNCGQVEELDQILQDQSAFEGDY